MIKHILVVDDEKDIRMLFKDELVDAGYGVLLAESGKEALEKLREHKIDLLILDLRMPDMDGIEVLQQVRESDKELPIIVCTAVRGLKDDYSIWEGNVSAFITKPLDLDELRRKVDEVLAK